MRHWWRAVSGYLRDLGDLWSHLLGAPADEFERGYRVGYREGQESAVRRAMETAWAEGFVTGHRCSSTILSVGCERDHPNPYRGQG